ncbi:MAG: hypothetical protein KAI79_09680, partial [Bacteroidales bacterium]|nr:hypothetical protein [Bacteroidales bacterium]
MNIFNKKELDFNLILSISTILFLPSFIFVAFNASSLAAGILIASIIVILINYKSIIGLQISLLAISLSIMFSLGVFISVAYFYVVESISKPLYSMVLVIVFLSTFILAQKISKMSYRVLSNSILVLILFFLLLGWIQVFYIPQCCNYSSQLKPIFPFSEESHYALALGILAVGYAFVGKLVWVGFIGICLLFLALLFPNMTLLVFSLLIFFA